METSTEILQILSKHTFAKGTMSEWRRQNFASALVSTDTKFHSGLRDITEHFPSPGHTMHSLVYFASVTATLRKMINEKLRRLDLYKFSIPIELATKNIK